MCFVVYFYNLANYKNMSTTAKMIFFPLLMVPGILDNIYDFVTGADVDKYKTTQLAVLIAIYVVMAIISVLYLGAYTYESMNPERNGKYIRLSTSDDDNNETDDGYSNRVPLGKWQRIIDEYMTANIIWAVTTYNLMLVVIYVARYITHADGNYIREVDVAIVSAVLLGLIVVLAILDFVLFKHPASGSVFMHYVVASVFALNFTVDFQSHVGFCELLTLGTFFLGVFLAVFKLKMFVELGMPASKKRD